MNEKIVATKAKLWTKDFIKVSLANLFLAFPFYILVVTLPLYLETQYGATTSHIGQIQFAFTITSILVRLLVGDLLDRCYRKHIYLVFFALFLFCVIGYPIMGTLTAVALLRAFQGIGWGGVNTAGSTIAIDLAPASRRGEAIGVFGMGMTIATAIVPLIGEYILQKTGSFNYPFVVGFVVGLIGLLLVISARIPRQERSETKVKKKITLFAKEAGPIGIVVVIAQMAYGYVMGYITLYAKTLSGAKSGLFFLIYALALLVARYMGGRIFDSKGAKLLLPSALLLAALSFVMLAFGESATILYVAAIPMGLGFGTLMSAGQALANYKVPAERRGVVNSSYMICHDGGVGLGMLLFGFVIQKSGYFASSLVAGALPILALLIFVFYTYPSVRQR